VDHPGTEQQLSSKDRFLQERVMQAIQELVMVRETRAPITVLAQDGVVTLKGNVLSEIMRRAVQYKAATTFGVTKVIDELYDDPAIELAVAAALSPHEALGARPIITTCYRGEVTLTGEVGSQDERTAAIETAAQVDGVRTVVDRLQTPADES
jgi:osmotically-inducible protein OsmY